MNKKPALLPADLQKVGEQFVRITELLDELDCRVRIEGINSYIVENTNGEDIEVDSLEAVIKELEHCKNVEAVDGIDLSDLQPETLEEVLQVLKKHNYT